MCDMVGIDYKVESCALQREMVKKVKLFYLTHAFVQSCFKPISEEEKATFIKHFYYNFRRSTLVTIKVELKRFQTVLVLAFKRRITA